MSLIQHAKLELDIYNKYVEDSCISEFVPEILNLINKVAQSGQSGGSIGYVKHTICDVISKLLSYETLTPVTGIDDEWMLIDENIAGMILYQNIRNSAIFKDVEGAYYLDGIIFKDITKGHYTFNGSIEYLCKRITSAQYIKSFPFEPKTFYVNIISDENDVVSYVDEDKLNEALYYYKQIN